MIGSYFHVNFIRANLEFDLLNFDHLCRLNRGPSTRFQVGTRPNTITRGGKISLGMVLYVLYISMYNQSSS
jgi:hypothetical protein